MYISLTYLKVLLTMGESLLEWWPSSPEFSIQTSSELNVRSLEFLNGMYLNIYPKHITLSYDITEMLKMSKPINGGCQLLKQSEISPSLFHSNIVWKYNSLSQNNVGRQFQKYLKFQQCTNSFHNVVESTTWNVGRHF